jgi:hypothetical protein
MLLYTNCFFFVYPCVACCCWVFCLFVCFFVFVCVFKIQWSWRHARRTAFGEVAESSTPARESPSPLELCFVFGCRSPCTCLERCLEPDRSQLRSLARCSRSLVRSSRSRSRCSRSLPRCSRSRVRCSRSLVRGSRALGVILAPLGVVSSTRMSVSTTCATMV